MSPKSYLIQLIVDAIKKNELKNAKKISEHHPSEHCYVIKECSVNSTNLLDSFNLI
jgi:hypothetical protein